MHCFAGALRVNIIRVHFQSNTILNNGRLQSHARIQRGTGAPDPPLPPEKSQK